MSLNPALRNIHQSVKDLIVEWQATKEQWNDAAARDFEKKYLQPLEPAARSALNALNQMEEVIQRARRDCSE